MSTVANRGHLTGLLALCVLLLALSAAPPAMGANPEVAEPIFIYEPVPLPPGEIIPPPIGLLEGPCGAAVGPDGDLYVSDYYHHTVDRFAIAPESEPFYKKIQLTGIDPLSGPCGLALDATGRLYVNSYHQEVLRFPPSSPVTFGVPTAINTSNPTGVAAGTGPTAVAINPTNDHVYVDYGDHVAEYDSAAGGNTVISNSIGSGIVEESFGLDVYGANGNIYVNDNDGRRIHILNPSGTAILRTITSADVPRAKGISTLFERPLAVDQSNGNVYVAYASDGEEVASEFNPSGKFVSELPLDKEFENANPSDMAVDNSGTASEGKVYASSRAAVYAFGPRQQNGDHLLVPSPEGSSTPQGEFSKACGTAVDRHGNVYIAAYGSSKVSIFRPDGSYITQFEPAGMGDGGCGLAVDSTGVVYVNAWHDGVYRFTPSAYPPTPSTTYGNGVPITFSTGSVYVNNRTYISVYGPSGAPMEVDGTPVRIGAGSLIDGYGVAVSANPATQGYVYVPDAGDNTVKVYDPATDTDNPIATIDGHETPTEGFVSLRDSAVAVDRVSGNVYVADNLQLGIAEEPETAIYVFGPSGAYLGRLKYNVVDAEPPGLAVDNSTAATQGQVYVTSGNTIFGSVYGYRPGAETEEEVPAHFDPNRSFIGNSGGPVGGGAGGSCAVACGAQPSHEAGISEVKHRGSLRLNLDGKLTPHSLPREGTAPIAVSVGWKLATTDGSAVPPLKKVRIEINRHGRFDYAGLPICPYNRIQPASSERALSACRSALVGQGSFTADIALKGQEPYSTQGRLLVFNGRSHGKPVLLGQIYSPHPFATSFVIVFSIEELRHGTYGTALTATLPPALASWGNLIAVEMKLSRRYRHAGKSHSYISAGCPAPKGFPGVVFPLARTSFDFAGDEKLSSTLTRSCTAR